MKKHIKDKEATNVEAILDEQAGEIGVFSTKTVVESVEEGEEDTQISIGEAKDIDEDVEVGTLEEAMSSCGVKILESITLFDVYRGSQLPEGKKSVSFSVMLRAADHTLTVDEADKATKKILGALEHKLGVTIRS